MNNLPYTKNLELDISNGWLTIWLNRPNNRNALTNDMIEDFNNVFNSIRNDHSVRGISFRGKRGVFCAGADLKEIKSIFDGKSKKEDVIRFSTATGNLFESIKTLPQVTIMVIEGAAMAGGLGLACCGDFIITHKDTRFSLTETRIGLLPAQISPFIIQRLGFVKGKQLMLTAAQINGEEALNIGLADFVGNTDSEVENLEHKIKNQVLKCAPAAVAETKRLINLIADLPREELVSKLGESFAEQVLSDEGREGIASFLEKRKPKWGV
jgi:isohexenylglutaconyl-CoA hydratase